MISILSLCGRDEEVKCDVPFSLHYTEWEREGVIVSIGFRPPKLSHWIRDINITLFNSTSI